MIAPGKKCAVSADVRTSVHDGGGIVPCVKCDADAWLSCSTCCHRGRVERDPSHWDR